MKTITYQKRIMVDHARKADRWLADSHKCKNPDLKHCALRLGMFHGAHFMQAVNEYLDTVMDTGVA